MILLLFACHGAAVDTGCSGTFPTCPASPPSWSADVQPIVAANCVSCHTPGGAAGSAPLDTYADVVAHQQSMSGQVYSCAMPRAPNPPLSEPDRWLLLTWLACGAPDN